MKNLLIFLGYFLVGITLVFGLKQTVKTINEQKLQTPIASHSFSLYSAPNNSLTGTVVSLNGDVEWESRTAIKASKIDKLIPIQQGESITTKEGNAKVNFSDTLNLNIFRNTKINFIQTLPQNIVVSQNSGLAEFKSYTKPVTVRTINLITKMNNNSDMEISFSSTRPIVMITIKSGSAVVAYNDPYFITQIADISSGEIFYFNTSTKQADLGKI